MKIQKNIENYSPWNEQEEVDKQIILRYLKEYPDIFYRENPIAHFSASSWIVNEERTKVLMVFHNFLAGAEVMQTEKRIYYMWL